MARVVPAAADRRGHELPAGAAGKWRRGVHVYVLDTSADARREVMEIPLQVHALKATVVLDPAAFAGLVVPNGLAKVTLRIALPGGHSPPRSTPRVCAGRWRRSMRRDRTALR